MTSPNGAPRDLHELFAPRSIALIGASDKSRWSWNTFTNLSSFDGDVYCVNPRAHEVHGVEAWPSLRSIGRPVDLAYVMVPTSAVLDTVTEAAKCGTRNVVCLTADFAEAGRQGRERQDVLAAQARSGGVTLLGPNGNGYINATDGIFPYGLPIFSEIRRGGVGIVLQSGALASSVLTMTQARDIGISKLVSMGNEAVVEMTDVVEHLIDDEATHAIALFIESIRDPDAFRKAALRALEAGKPVVALKVGRSEIGARAAMAHTGALAGDDRVVDAVFRQLGVIRVDSLEDLIITAGLLAETGPLTGDKAIFVTPSGGACDIIADRCEVEGIRLPEFDAVVADKLRQLVPGSASVHNPLDVTGYVVVDPDLLPNALKAATEDPGTDLVVGLAEPPRSEPPRVETAEKMFCGLAEVARSSSIPVVFMGTAGTDITEFGKAFAARTGFPAPLSGIEHGLSALGHAIRWSGARRAARAQRRSMLDAELPRLPADREGVWSELMATEFLSSCGVPVVPSALARSAADAVAGAEDVGYPVVLKVVSPDLPHKSDVGGVRLGLDGPDAVRAGFRAMMADVRGKAPDARIDGVLVSPMRSSGTELLVGVVRDPQWGLVLAVGLGGVWVEIFADSTLRVLPVDAADVKQMLGELRGSALLNGARGRAPADVDKVADVVLRVADLAVALGDRLESLEINPLFVDGERIEALDALITWQK